MAERNLNYDFEKGKIRKPNKTERLFIKNNCPKNGCNRIDYIYWVAVILRRQIILVCSIEDINFYKIITVFEYK